MIYRVFSNSFVDDRTESAQNSWNMQGINNIPINDSELPRNNGGLPYLKDILDIGFQNCKDDRDIILYTNSDIGIVKDIINFPDNNFFSVRKNIESIGEYKISDLEKISYEHSINCDVFGLTKCWYKENRDKIPDFLIGSPTWDLCLLILLKGQRIDNICYHVKHESKWKGERQSSQHLSNRKLFVDFCVQHDIKIITTTGRILSNKFYQYMAENFGFGYLLNPKYIIYNTPSHKQLLEHNINSLQRIHKDQVIVYTIEDNNQYCDTANYHQLGWKQTQVNKVQSLISTLGKFNDNEIFIFCDADIIHLENYIEDIANLLNSYEMVAQGSFSQNKLNNSFCSGFFAAKKSDKVIRFLSYILQSLKSTLNSESHADQYYFNKYANILNIGCLSDNYFNPGIITEGKRVNRNDFAMIVNSSKNKSKIVHANWINGCEDKLEFLKMYIQ